MKPQPEVQNACADPETEAFMEWLRSDENAYAMALDMGNGMWCGLKRLMYHWTMHIGAVGDKTGYEDRYCYADFNRALVGLLEWQARAFAGEPTGWRKHPKTDRCRNDNGDPESETIGWPEW